MFFTTTPKQKVYPVQVYAVIFMAYTYICGVLAMINFYYCSEAGRDFHEQLGLLCHKQVSQKSNVVEKASCIQALTQGVELNRNKNQTRINRFLSLNPNRTLSQSRIYLRAIHELPWIYVWTMHGSS